MNMLQTKKEELKKQGKKGFTLMELLIVVAIIAVLVAIAIPLFTNQLEKSREAVDEANIRDAYAVLVAAQLTNDDSNALAKHNTDDITYTIDNGKYTATVKATQREANWVGGKPNIAGKKDVVAVYNTTSEGTNSWTITVNAEGVADISASSTNK